MLKYVTGKSAEFLCICLALDKGRKDCKKRHICMVSICLSYADGEPCGQEM